MREMTDLVISVPSSSTPRIQEAHLLIEHSICEIIENMVCEGGIE
jgi:D-sedoheptulose 7-phosphate isomerase